MPYPCDVIIYRTPRLRQVFLWKGTLERDRHGFALTGKGDGFWRETLYLLETKAPGVFVLGEVGAGAVRRVANSVGEGSVALCFIR